MKKLGKILIIIIVVIGVIVGGVFTFNKIKEVKKDNERINAKNLMEYIKTHNSPSDFCEGEDCDEYMISSLTENGFKCNVLDKNIKDIYGNYLILEDNSIYEMDFNQLYSNNQNCKKVEMKMSIKDILLPKYNDINRPGYIISTDNQVYTFNYFDNISKESYPLMKNIILNGDVKQVIHRSGEYMGNDKMKSTYILLKNDGVVYKEEYLDNKLTDKEELISNNEYGKISYIEGYYDTTNNKFNINTIISDKGYYYKGEVITEECTKYKDVKCEEKIMESEIYNKFSKDIKYIGQTYTLLTDNTIIYTNSLTRKLDKDLK